MTNVTNKHHSEPEDLTVISGIGKSRQQWLRKNFDVRTLADLANLSANDLETQLKANGRVISRDQIESWLEQARQLTSHPNAADVAIQFVVHFHQHRDENDVIHYQTKVRHTEADKSAEWPGIELTQLSAWMMEALNPQINPPMAPIPEVRSIPSPNIAPVTAPNISSDRYHRLLARAQGNPPVSRVEAAPAQPPPAGSRDQRLVIKAESLDRPAPPPMVIENAAVQFGKIEVIAPLIAQRNTPFTVETRFELSSTTADAAECSVSFYAHQRTSGKVIDLGVAHVRYIPDGKNGCQADLSNIELDPGAYRLQVVIRVRGASGPGYGEMPFIRVL